MIDGRQRIAKSRRSRVQSQAACTNTVSFAIGNDRSEDCMDSWESGEKACDGTTVCTDNGGAACGLQGMPSRFLCTGHRVRCSASNWCWGPAYVLGGFEMCGWSKVCWVEYRVWVGGWGAALVDGGSRDSELRGSRAWDLGAWGL